LIKTLALFVILFNSSGEKLLDDISKEYASADGFQWQIRSVVYSEIFEEAETTFVEIGYAPPDTFSMISELEKIIGIGDTLWVMSARHRQVQKKPMAGLMMPFEFVLNWKDSYDLDSCFNDGSGMIFDLAGKEDVIPEKLMIAVDGKMKVRKISYTDSKGDDVVLTVRRQKLERPRNIDFFYLHIPDDFDFIDLTE
jgi:outer membrane lipoprotein-sorting protein